MKTSEQINELAAALSAFQGEVEDTVKDTKAYGYKYADLAQLLQIARPLMAKHGLSLVQLPYTPSPDSVGVTTRLAHKSGQWIEDRMEMAVEPKKGLSFAQCAGSTVTYIRRYAAGAVFGIASEADDDGASGRDSTDRQAQRPTLVPPAYINAGQRAKVEAMLKETGTGIERFLAHYQAESLEKFPAHAFEAAIAALNARKAKAEAQAAGGAA